MNQAEEHWLTIYLDTGDAKRATKEAYPDVAEENIATKASRKKRELADQIDAAVRLDMKADAGEMISIIKNLARNAQSEAVRQSCAIRVVEMAGHKEATVIEDKRESGKSIEERLSALMADPDIAKQLEANPALHASLIASKH